MAVVEEKYTRVKLISISRTNSIVAISMLLKTMAAQCSARKFVGLDLSSTWIMGLNPAQVINVCPRFSCCYTL